MKNLILTGLLLCISFSFVYAQEMTFEYSSCNVGILSDEKPITRDFSFTNTGDKPLVLYSIITSCGCTTIEWKKTPYLPGEKGLVRFNYYPKNRNDGTFMQVAEITSNAINVGVQKGMFALTIYGKLEVERLPIESQYNLNKNESQQESERNEEKNTFARSNPFKADSSDVYQLILSRLAQQYRSNASKRNIDNNVETVARNMRRGGYFLDIDYSCLKRTNWEPEMHLKRINMLVDGYVEPESSYFANDTLFSMIIDGLQYWADIKPKSNNWWHNQIGYPGTLSAILVKLQFGFGSHLINNLLIPNDEREKLRSFVFLPTLLQNNLVGEMTKSDPRSWTGANKLDIAKIHFVKGLLQRNDSILRVTIDEAFYPVRITDTEGIRADFSYQQHGPQLYIGGYGTVFVSETIDMIALLNGTPFAISDDKYTLFSYFLDNTYYPTFRRQIMDFSVVGRRISRMGGERLSDIQPAVVSSNKSFWLSDYMLHNRPQFQASIRSSSITTFKCESGNGENLLGTYLSDGCLNIRRIGNEYDDIFSVWEWDKIPGTTAPAGERTIASAWGELGKSTFTGSVSDSLYGAFVYQHNDYGFTAHKSFFFLDNVVVALAAGITSEQPQQLFTAVNQCHLRGTVERYTKKEGWTQLLSNDSVNLSGVQTIVHDGISYIFPEPVSLTLKTKRQNGSWSRINLNQSSIPISMPVFNLVINQDTPSYAYAMLVDAPSKKLAEQMPVKILSNTTTCQAIFDPVTKQYQANYYQPAKIKFKGGYLAVDQPCQVIIRPLSSGGYSVALAVPKLKEDTMVNVEFKYKGFLMDENFKVSDASSVLKEFK